MAYSNEGTARLSTFLRTALANMSMFRIEVLIIVAGLALVEAKWQTRKQR